MRLTPYKILIREGRFTINRYNKNKLWVIVGKNCKLASAYFDKIYLHKTGKWHNKPINGKEKGWYYSGSNGLYHTKEEAENTLREWFKTQPDEAFAEYIAERLIPEESEDDDVSTNR